MLDAAVPLLPEGADVCLMADRFYGTADLISWCQDRKWDYRLRLKGNLVVRDAEDGAIQDSRVPVEIVFDQGLGDLFVIRVAGNIVAPSQVGSVELSQEAFLAILKVKEQK